MQHIGSTSWRLSTVFVTQETSETRENLHARDKLQFFSLHPPLSLLIACIFLSSLALHKILSPSSFPMMIPLSLSL